MSTLILDKVLSGYNLAKVNDNFERIEKAFNEALLHRDGSKSLTDDLDVNSQKLLNVAGIEIGGVDITQAVSQLRTEYEAIIDEIEAYKAAADEILQEAISYGAVDKKSIGNAQSVFVTTQSYATNANLTLPLPYVVGKNTLHLNMNHYYGMFKGVDYEEVGTVNTQSTTIKLLKPVASGVQIEEWVDGDNDLYSIYSTAEALQDLLTTSYSPESIEAFVSSVSDIQELGLEDKIAQLNSLYDSLVSLQTDLQTTVADINTKYSTITDMYEDVGTKYSLLETLYPQLLRLISDTDFDLDDLNSAIGDLNDAIEDINEAMEDVQGYADAASDDADAAASSASDAADSALEAAGYVSTINTSVNNARIWAEGTDTEVATLSGTHSAKEWAAQAESVQNAVKYTSQSLTTTQKTQARTNIGAFNINDGITATGSTTARTLADWTADVVDIRKNFINTTFRKKLFLEVDFHFEGYADAKTAVGATNLFPQAADVSGDNLYVLYISQPSTVTKQVVATFNLKTGEFIRWNILNPCRPSQWIVARNENDTDFLYVSNPTNYKILKYQTSSTSESALTAVSDDCNDITAGSFVSYNNGRWFVMGIDKQVSVGRQSAVWVFDDDWNKIGSWAWRQYDFDLLEQDYTDPIARSVQHKQGLVFGANTAYVFSGGSSSFDTSSNDHRISDIGVIEHDFYGNVLRSSVCDSAKFITKAPSAAGGTISTSENESGFILPDGRVISLIVFNSGDDRRLTFWEEFSTAEDATDFSDCATVQSNIPWLCDVPQFPKMDNGDSQSGISGDYQGEFYNPFTNEALDTLDDAIIMMAVYGLDRLVFSCPKLWTTLGNQTIFTRDGTINDTENYTVELLRNTSGCVFVNIFYRNNTGANEYNCTYRVNINTSTRAISGVTLMSQKVAAFQANTATITTETVTTSTITTANVTTANVGKVVINQTGEGVISKVGDAGVLRLDGGSDWGSGASIVVGSKGAGGGSVSRSGGVEIRTSVNSNGTGGDHRLRIVNDGDMSWDGLFKCYRNNQYSLGTAENLWTEVFAAAGTINTSDERLKDNITDISDDVLDAWGDVNIKVFQFKDAIKKKGEDARIHTGVIAQQVQQAFEARGLNAFRYGLLCYDEWDATDAVYDEIEVVDQDGVTHIERVKIEDARPAGNLYSIRYEEALVLEAAYQRRRADRIEARLLVLEERLG